RSTVSSPSLAAAAAASHPAWPAPTTTTSAARSRATPWMSWGAAFGFEPGSGKRSVVTRSLPDAEAAEDSLQQIFVDGPPRHLADRRERFAQLERHDLSGRPVASRIRGARQRRTAAFE